MSHSPAGPPGEITRQLDEARCHGGAAMDRLFELVYDELRRVAAARLRQFGGTLSATGLVHEVYLKFASGGSPKALGRAHFLAIAARAMRQLLIDHHREGAAIKRGGGWAQTTLGEAHGAVTVDADHLLDLDDALERLEARQRQVAEYRLFAGMEEREIAEILGISERTVRRDWTKARAWLVHALVLRPDG
jgi:RNA polymerase sigma factor (TIGR02999 family)